MSLDYLSELRRTTAEFATTVRSSDLDASVEACPGWTVRDLVAHLGAVHRWAAAIVTWGETGHTNESDPPESGAEALSDWYSASAVVLLSALEGADPAQPCWNFSGVNPTKGFWWRRQVHEVHVHLFDLARAGGAEPAPSDPVFAADGVSEVVDVFMPRLARKDIVPDVTDPLALVATDAGLAWSLTPRDALGQPPADGSPGVDRIPLLGRHRASDPLPPDQLRGDAETLLRVLWKRATPDRLTWVGDSERLSRFLTSQLTS